MSEVRRKKNHQELAGASPYMPRPSSPLLTE
jgi:hypothetical protein